MACSGRHCSRMTGPAHLAPNRASVGPASVDPGRLGDARQRTGTEGGRDGATNAPKGLWARRTGRTTMPPRQCPTARRSGPAYWGDPPMHGRPLRRATALALAVLLVLTGTAMADQLLADGDVLNSGIQGTKALGNVAAGAEVSVQVEFTL